MLNAPSAAASTKQGAFEWLSGGLFFGKGKGGIDSVWTCNDVASLIKGIEDDLNSILASPAPTVNEKSEGEITDSTEDVKDDEAESEPSPAKFLEARLTRLRFLLYDERRKSSQQDGRRMTPMVAGATVQEVVSPQLQHLLPTILRNMATLPFESRKHAAAIFNYLLVCGLEGSDGELYEPVMISFREYIESRFDEILTLVVQGHDCSAPGASDVGLHCGSIYRSCFKHANLYRQLVSTTQRVEQYIFPFLDKFVHVPNFDIASDAMESLRMVFTAGFGPQTAVTDAASQQIMAELAAEFLSRDYEAIWDQRFNPKLLSDQANYMIRRVALQVLSTILLTRSNYAVMIRYVNSRKNLILVMHLLRDTSPHITLDAFHVFKVFVANPNKIPEVEKILKDNRDKLCNYLESLHSEKEATDNQFRDEKALIISTIQGL